MAGYGDIYDDVYTSVHPFNLCEEAAKEEYWDIVQLALDHNCRCSNDIKLQLLDKLLIEVKLYNLKKYSK